MAKSKKRRSNKRRTKRNKKGGLFSFLSPSKPSAKPLFQLVKEKEGLIKEIKRLNDERQSGHASASILTTIGTLKLQLDELNQQIDDARNRVKN
jgi:hypothetical protein